MGNSRWPFLLKCHVEDGFSWAFAGVYEPNANSNWMDCARSRLVFVVDENYYGVLVRISMSLDYQVRDRVKLIFVCICWISQTSSLSRILWMFPLWKAPSRGLPVQVISLGQEVTDSTYLQIRNCTFLSKGSLHLPIILNWKSTQKGGMYFTFENMWLKAQGFVNSVRQ